MPQSTYVQTALALAHYNQRDFDQAQILYKARVRFGFICLQLLSCLFHTHEQKLQQREPHRLDGMDAYSNILYVTEAKGELSYLAHTAMKTEKVSSAVISCAVKPNFLLCNSTRRSHAASLRITTR